MKNKETEIELGKAYKDIVTGFSGIAVSRTTFLWSCARVALQPVGLHEKRPIEPQYFDEHQLVEDKKQKGIDASKLVAAASDPGGPGECAKPHRVMAARR